jgi:hypothetical protein
MSFKRLETDDFVVSSDSVTTGIWTNNATTLTEFYTSSTQESAASGQYYLNVYQTSSTLTGAEVQFAIAYGNKEGSGSLAFDLSVDGKSPTSTIYGQYRTLVNGDENTDFIFSTVTSSEFFALSVDRNRYKEKLFPGILTFKISGSDGVLSLTDDSNYVTSQTFTDAGRVFNLISGSAGTKVTTSTTTPDGYSLNSGSYGWFLPDIGTILLNPLALSAGAAGGGCGFTYSGSVSSSASPSESPNAKLFTAISQSDASTFILNSEETITSDYVFVRPRSSEFNYSENPSYISGSTGEIIYDSFINNPISYITTVGLYNDNNELLAVAKLSRPLKKDFTKEALVRVKLDF